MKKLILILLVLPLFVFSQEEKTYTRTMSVSQFTEELKEAAKQKKDYFLEDCEIIYNEEVDTLYIHHGLGRWTSTRLIISDISFIEGSSVTISNCSFLKLDHDLTMKHMRFWDLTLIDIATRHAKLDSISVLGNLDIQYRTVVNDGYWNIYNSNINKFTSTLSDSIYLEMEMINKEKKEWQKNASRRILENNKISYADFNNIDHISLMKNQISFLSLKGKIKNAYINDNQFSVDFRNITNIRQMSNNQIRVGLLTGIKIRDVEMKRLHIHNNSSTSIKNLTNNSLIDIIKRYKDSINVRSPIVNWEKEQYKFNKLRDTLFWEKIDSLILKEQLECLKKMNNENDSLQIIYPIAPIIEIEESNFDVLQLSSDTFQSIYISRNDIKNALNLNNLSVEEILVFNRNNLPASEKIKIDETSFNNLGFFYFNEQMDMPYYGNNIGQPYYGNEEYYKVKELLKNEAYLSKLDELIITYRQFINILAIQGGKAKKDGVLKLKDLETAQKIYDYYKDPNMNTWFNWKGSEFLRWYSDYGTNPFKALTYCFWAMLYFAMFYFIFYNEWDKIDRGFLIKRFNSVMDYFTTEKRIEDFYYSTHNKEMTTFTEFKETLDKNKVYMPSMLASLAKPIYQISLLRYKTLRFSYTKAEFMAGRKWVDLEQKEKYWIGTLTFFLTLTYIIYLVFIRALNSIVLSINAFSTLGFGQIPVRGFTKYVAIIEGFIGWFLLSIFLVSVLSQMMSV